MQTTPRIIIIIIIIGGPSGAGKTTFAREFHPSEAACPVLVNADLIAAGLAPSVPETAALQAGRLMLQELKRHFAAHIVLHLKRHCWAGPIFARLGNGKKLDIASSAFFCN